MPATARLIVMVEKDEKAALEARAKAANLSTAELVRRHLFGRTDPEEEAFLQVLAELKPMVRKACRTIDQNLAAIRSQREGAHERETRLAKRTRGELADDELASIADRLQLGATNSSTRRRS